MSKALVVTPDLETKIRTVDYDWKLSLTKEEEKIIEIIKTKENLSDLTMTYTINKVPFIYQKIPLFYNYAHYSSSNENSARIYYELYKLGYKDETILNLTEQIEKFRRRFNQKIDDTKFKISNDDILSLGIVTITDFIAPDTEDMDKRIYFNAVREANNSLRVSYISLDYIRTLYSKIKTLNSNKKTLAAGAFYVITLMEGERRMQKEIAQAMQISEVSVRNNYKKIAGIIRSIQQAQHDFIEFMRKPEKTNISYIMYLMHNWDMEFCIE